MFGAGTAAVIAPIQSITFHEEELRVNAHNESELSKRLLDTILGPLWSNSDPYYPPFEVTLEEIEAITEYAGTLQVTE
jgi:hypothetical protein